MRSLKAAELAMVAVLALLCRQSEAAQWDDQVRALVEAARGDNWKATKEQMLAIAKAGDAAVAPLAACLVDPAASRDACWALIGTLKFIRKDSARKAMGDALLTGHQEARLAAAWEIGVAYEPTELLPQLKQALDSDIPRIRILAALALHRLNENVDFQQDDARKLVLELLPSTKNQYTQIRAFEVLEQIGDGSCCSLLLDLFDKEGRLGSDAWASKLEHIRDSLVAIGSREAVDGLIVQLGHPNELNRRLAAQALRAITGGIFGDARIDLWTAWWQENRQRYLADPALPYGKLTAEQELKAQALIEQCDVRSRNNPPCSELAELGPAVIPLLRKSPRLLQNVRGAVYVLMGKPGYDQLKREHVEWIDSGWGKAAAEMMWKLEPKATADFLVEYHVIGKGRLVWRMRHKNDSVEYFIRDRRELLVKCCYREQVPRIREMLLGEDLASENRIVLAQVLNHFEGPKAMDWLVALLKRDTTPAVERLCLLEIAIGLGADAADAALAAVGRDKLPAVFKEAFLATDPKYLASERGERFGRLWPDEIVPVLGSLCDGDAPEELRLHAAISLRRLNRPDAAARLVRFFASAQPAVRKAAVSSLRPEDVPQLLTAVAGAAQNDADLEVRIEALRLIGASKSNGAIPMLMQLIHDPDDAIVYNALHALDAITGRSASFSRKDGVDRYDQWWANERKPETEKLDEWQLAIREEKQQAKSPFNDDVKAELILAYPRDSFGATAFSEDGGQMAFAWSTGAKRVGVKVMDIDGKNRLTILEDGVPQAMSFSPDGRKLAIVSHRGATGAGEEALSMIDLATGKERILLKWPSSPLEPGGTSVPSFVWLGADRLAAYCITKEELTIDLFSAADGKRTTIYDSAASKPVSPAIRRALGRGENPWAPFFEQMSATDKGDIYFCWYGAVLKVNADSKKADVVCRRASTERIFTCPRANREGTRLLLPRQAGGCVCTLFDPDLSNPRTFAEVGEGSGAGPEHSAQWFRDGKHLAALNLAYKDSSIVIACANGQRKATIPILPNSMCSGVWVLGDDSVAVLSNVAFWRISVAGQLKAVDAMPAPKVIPAIKFAYPDFSSPLATLHTAGEACRRGDFDGLRRCFTPEAGKELAGYAKENGDEAVLGEFERAADVEGEPEVQINGERATVKWTSAGRAAAMPLRKVAGEWKIVGNE